MDKVQMSNEDMDDFAFKTKAVDEFVNKSFGYDITRDTDQNNGNGVWSQEIQAFLDSTTLKGLFYSEDWVFITIDLLANKISSQPMLVYQTTIDDEQEVTEEDYTHPLSVLLQQPNEWQD